MKILWISWKDWQYPGAGGAEVVMFELIKRQIAAGHDVTVLTALYPGASREDILDGARIIRLKGSRYLQPFITLPYYIRHLRGKYDMVVEAVNTAPYFSPFFRGRAKSVLLYHQLARQTWFYEAPLPLALIGFLFLEPIATFILSRSKATVIAMSDSTKRDLARFGFNPAKTHIISEGIQMQPVADIAKIQKYKDPTLLSFGAMRNMKRTLDQIKAFESAKQDIPNLKMKISGSAKTKYGQQVLAYIANSPYAADIEYLGHVSEKQRIELMQKCHIVLQTAIKEGWGLTITEANSQGTPAVVYDADGLRDSVRHNKTGMVTNPNPQALSVSITALLQNNKLYNKLRNAAWQWSKQITFDQSYKDFIKATEATT